MSGPDVWATPGDRPAPGRRPRDDDPRRPAGEPRRSTWTTPTRALAVLAGGTALVVALVATATVLRDATQPGADDPRSALEAWLDAAEDGDVDDVLAAVAPSQRDAVDPADPLGLQLASLDVQQRWVDGGETALLSPDEALVRVGGETCPDPTPPDGAGCLDLVGTGPGGTALALREQGRWWAVAAPVRLVPRPAPTGP